MLKAGWVQHTHVSNTNANFSCAIEGQKWGVGVRCYDTFVRLMLGKWHVCLSRAST